MCSEKRGVFTQVPALAAPIVANMRSLPKEASPTWCVDLAKSLCAQRITDRVSVAVLFLNRDREPRIDHRSAPGIARPDEARGLDYEECKEFLARVAPLVAEKMNANRQPILLELPKLSGSPGFLAVLPVGTTERPRWVAVECASAAHVDADEFVHVVRYAMTHLVPQAVIAFQQYTGEF